MRPTASTLSFVVSLILGIGLTLLPSPSTFVTSFLDAEALSYGRPGFTKEEATAKLGRRVRVVYSEPIMIGKRSSKGFWLDVEVGSRGTVKEIAEFLPGRYDVIVEWDEPQQDAPWVTFYRSTGDYSNYYKCLVEE